MSIQSESGKGTRVTLTAPLQVEKSKQRKRQT
jgi:hypothetical protein